MKPRSPEREPCAVIVITPDELLSTNDSYFSPAAFEQHGFLPYLIQHFEPPSAL